MDYNIEAGAGTEITADSFGDGLLQHQRTYLEWLDRIFEKYPDLVIEHCSSGALRMSYAYMRRHSVCSTTDNENYQCNAVISVNSATCVSPEQAGVWVYPVAGGDEEVIMNLINGMLWRIYLSGQVMEMNKKALDLIKQALAYYKNMRQKIAEANPIWPLGLSNFNDDNAAFGLKHNNTIYLAVWCFNATAPIKIPLEYYGEIADLELQFPIGYPCETTYNKKSVTITIPENSARLLKITLK